jgi:plasmid maintenance system antidote protein VapI
MEKHPMDFLREEFIEPMGVTQNILHENLDMSMKTISELYQHKRSLTVSTAKKFRTIFWHKR